MNLTEFRICPNCGSTENLENYPTPGNSMCGKCSHRTVKIPLTEMKEDQIYSQDCTFCGKEGEDGDTLFENDNVVVFKCKKCGTIDGYKINQEPDYFDSGNDEPYDGSYSFKTIKTAEKEGTSKIFSAAKYQEMGKALKKKEKDTKIKCNNQLYKLLKEKTEQLEKLGIRKDLIASAFRRTQSYIEKKGVLTEKQLTLLFCGSLIGVEDAQLRRREINKCNATERNLAELFNVDRKSIRKWKWLLKKEVRPPKWEIWLHQENGLFEFGFIEIPKDIQVALKLEKPYKSICCFCGRNSELIWRIKYTNGCWSDICLSSYEMFKKTYWEYEGAITLP
jgi:transcription initiation factor TFIIIB Brf1 subunit/transcription initiation factor TFIIB